MTKKTSNRRATRLAQALWSDIHRRIHGSCLNSELYETLITTALTDFAARYREAARVAGERERLATANLKEALQTISNLRAQLKVVVEAGGVVKGGALKELTRVSEVKYKHLRLPSQREREM